MLDKIFGPPLHEHVDPAQRLIGIAALPADSAVLAQLLRSEPVAEVRAAAARRCANAVALTTALRSEAEPSVKAAIVAALGKVLADSAADADLRAALDSPECTDGVRGQVALQAQSEERRRAAIDRILDENVLVDVALEAEHASVRLAAAERVHAPDALRRLLKGARDKDRGVTRLARERLDAISQRAQTADAADALLREAEALVAQSGPIVTAAVELDRRWKALGLGEDAERLARWDAIGRQMQQRFDRELAEQRTHTQFEQRLNTWLASLQSPPSVTVLPALRDELAALRAEALQHDEAEAGARLERAALQLVQWEQAATALAAAEALVIEAEQLAAGTPIDDAQLPTRWQALDLAVRTPALTRRFESALLVIEQRRLAQVRAAQQEQGAARHELHAALHEAELALAAGHVQEARAAADRTRALKAQSGVLPKPTIQRLSRVVQQLVDLERWQSFGQHTARVQLCERAEGMPQQGHTPAQLAREVQQLRAEWKKLDEQHAGVPKPLWERFDAACERAYAPAARHFAEQAAQHKQARRQRDEFVTAAAARVPALLEEPRDWRAIERSMREIEAAWHGKDLGSVEPAAWKKLDVKLKAALAPLHDALRAARDQARQEREAMITEAEALVARAAERDAPSLVKGLQSRWQANAKSIVLPQRDERALWDRFRAACNGVFEAREGSRRQADERRHAQRRSFELVCEQLEQLAHSDEGDAAQVRQRQRELQDQWTRAVAESGPVPAALDARFRAARHEVEQRLRGQARASEAATWEALLARERLCEELDALALQDSVADAATVASVPQRWTALAPVSADWDKRLLQRRDAALHALADEDARYDHADRVKKCVATRRDALLELELTLGLDSPSDLQPQRLAVQVKHLRDRFKRTTSGGAGSTVEMLLEWCALPGIVEPRDLKRVERIVAKIDRRR
ncbi:MAG TPA: DUF349 domain-containing protein [Burkholderiaceae bacterium]|nr:DUF349 domain-containing protein [Burkholderiaceae bacterium]HQR70889.1 DUF349 domain-containing protein [Burkholderiaceae bacterium]